MTTLLTTLHTPCDTGVTRDNVLKANCTATKSGGDAAGMSQLLTESSKVKRNCRHAQTAHIARKHTFTHLAQSLLGVQMSCMNTLAAIHTPMQEIVFHEEVCSGSVVVQQLISRTDSAREMFSCIVMLRQELTIAYFDMR